VSDLSIYYAKCSRTPDSCPTAVTTPDPSINCAATTGYYYKFYEQFTYTNPGPNSTPITVNWKGSFPDGNPDPGPTPYERAAGPNRTVKSDWSASPGYKDKLASTPGKGHIQVDLSWRNPDGKTEVKSASFDYECK
jgi:hypothetical protein